MFLGLKFRSRSLFSNNFFKQSKVYFASRSEASFFPEIKRKSVLLDKSKHKVVYEFPFIILPAAFLRSRFSVPILFFISAPFLSFFSEINISSVTCIVTACIHYLFVTAVRKPLQNIVGKIYVNKEGYLQNVIISSVDQFGRRIDRIHNPDNLINYEYYNKLWQRTGFMRLAIENSNVYYKVNVRHCKIHDLAICNYLFGNLWIVSKKENER